MNQNACSIIVPTYNRIFSLKKCLSSLLNLNFTTLEIIIVNDGSTDATKKYLNSLNNAKIRVIHHGKNLGKSKARNTGIKKAIYNFIAFIDDDCIADKRWLCNLLKGITEKNANFTFGNTYYIKKNNKAYFPERCVNITNWPGGGNIAYHRKIFEQIGCFDSYFDKYNNEDSEMAIRAIANNFSCAQADNALCYHQQMDWTTTSLLNSAKNASVWTVLKKKYPMHYNFFNPPIWKGIIINPKDYFFILVIPILIPLLLIRYFWHGKKNLKIFFAKWPVHLLLKRYYIYKEVVRNRVWMM